MRVREQGSEVISKSERKRQAHKVEDLARYLVEVPASALEKLKLEAQAKTVLEHARGLSKGARKREIKHLAGLLRNNADQLEYLLKFQEGVGQAQLEEHCHFHRLENWREALCDVNRRKEALQELGQTFSSLDIAGLEKLVDAYQKSGDKKSYRQIFTMLRRAAEFDAGEY